MSSITISELDVAGLSLFMHGESYLDEVTDGELDSVNGGIFPAVAAFFAASSPECAAVAYAGAQGALVGISISVGVTARK